MRVGAAAPASSMLAKHRVLVPYSGVYLVHGARQPGPLCLFFEAGEERKRVQVVGNQVAQGNAHEKRFLMGPAGRALTP